MIRFKRLTLGHCLYFQSLRDFELKEDIQTVYFLASQFCIYESSEQLLGAILSLPMQRFTEVLAKLISAYKLCMAVEKKKIYETIYYLNQKSFNSYQSLLDIPLGDINIMIEIVNENQQVNII